MSTPYSTIIFDFDYTLADSSRGVFQCINFALSRLGLSKVTYQRVCRTIGMSLPDTFVQLTGSNSDRQIREFSRLFIQRADEVMADLTEILEPVPHTINVLKKQDFSFGIVSTKFRYRIESILAREKLLSEFDVIVGGEDVSMHKPDPEGVQKAMELLQSSPSDTIYVGDSVVDAETAERAGVHFIAVLTGTTERDAFDEYEVYAIIRHFQDLPELVSTGSGQKY
jgi:phosphoglycolate phosphatase